MSGKTLLNCVTLDIAVLQKLQMRASEFTKEAVYPGNIGAMEVHRFFMVATPEQKAEVKKLIATQQHKAAWKIIQTVLNVKLHGKEFA